MLCHGCPMRGQRGDAIKFQSGACCLGRTASPFSTPRRPAAPRSPRSRLEASGCRQSVRTFCLGPEGVSTGGVRQVERQALLDADNISQWRACITYSPAFDGECERLLVTSHHQQNVKYITYVTACFVAPRLAALARIVAVLKLPHSSCLLLPLPSQHASGNLQQYTHAHMRTSCGHSVSQRIHFKPAVGR